MKNIKKINKKAILAELREQDIKLEEIFNRRKELAELAKKYGCHNDLWEKLFSDGKSHYNF